MRLQPRRNAACEQRCRLLIDTFDDPRAKVTLGMLLANRGQRDWAVEIWREAARQGDTRAADLLP